MLIIFNNMIEYKYLVTSEGIKPTAVYNGMINFSILRKKIANISSLTNKSTSNEILYLVKI